MPFRILSVFAHWLYIVLGTSDFLCCNVVIVSSLRERERELERLFFVVFN